MTTMLGQQQLMEPAPVRRLIVARGAGTAHYGVDPSTRRVSIACAQTREVITQSFVADDDDARRLDDIYLQTLSCVDRLANWPLPGLVWVEQPSGKQQNWPLAYAVGVIQAALYQAVSRMCMAPVLIETVPSATWKKTACGRGNLYKPKRGDEWEYGVLTWARQNGYAGHSYDEADALGIAEAARRTVMLEHR